MKNFITRILIIITLMALSSVPFKSNSADAANKQNVKKHSSTVLHLKFSETDEVDLHGETFTSKSGKDLSRVNETLAAGKVSKKSRLFTANPETLKAERKALKAKNASAYVPDLSNYYRIELKENENIDAVVQTLKQNPAVSEAYAEPLPVIAPATPEYGSLQTHFGAAPTGMGISASASLPGALGDRIKIADLEYSWNTNHEDLSDARQADTFIANGTPVDPFYSPNSGNDTRHGTAVAALLSADRNGIGVNGIISNAKLHLVNTNTAERGWDMPNAIYLAKSRMTAGDVILIEHQVWGPQGNDLVPVEWIPAVYDAIKATTLSGINVVEAAGNGRYDANYQYPYIGGVNLDDPVYGTTFPANKPDSGAIIVGAGTACYGTTSHSRIYTSNFGRRVNVQGYGECVVTAGYGNMYNGGPNALYTDSFSATSSASALVAAAAGSVSSSYEFQKNANMTPLQIRTLLMQTGTPQDKMYDFGNIGPLPNLAAAIKTFTPAPDVTKPTTPYGLTGYVVNRKSISLNWQASTDNSGSVKYNVYRNNVLIATTTNRSYADYAVSRNVTYSYRITAVDPSNNVSGSSNTVSLVVR